MKTADQELFDAFYQESVQLEFETYDYRPPASEKVDYPFVEIGDTQTVASATKTSAQATVQLEINVWGTAEQRKRVSEMTEALFSYARTLNQTQNRRVSFNMGASSLQMLTDTTVPNTTLKRGLLTLEFLIY